MLKILFFPNTRGLALVTKALLVAIGLHALLTLVFVDLRLTTLLERAHVSLLVGLVSVGQ